MSQEIIIQDQATQKLEMQLITTLAAATVRDITKSDNQDLRLILSEIQYGLTKEKALASPAVFVVKKRIGEQNTLKLMCFLITSFQNSLNVKEKLTAADIIEVSEMILETYTHDSIKDVMLALKDAKKVGKNFYNVLSQQTIMEILKGYFEEKALWLESRHKDVKATSENNSITFIQGLAERSPEQLSQMGNMIHPAHINREHLRLRKNIQKQRLKRGLGLNDQEPSTDSAAA